MKISVILPTRKRPAMAQAFLQSLYETCRNPDEVEIVVLTDDDDDSYRDFNSPFRSTLQISGQRTGMGEITYNGIIQSSGDIIFLCNDDVLVQSKSWDTEFRKIHQHFSDGIYLMAPNDMNKSNNLFVFPVFSRKLFHLLEDFPKIYQGAFIDTHIHEMFKSLKYRGHDRMVFLEHVQFAHNHFRVTGEAPDSTYQERKRFGDDWIFLTSVGVRKQISDRLMHHISNVPEHRSLDTGQLSLLLAVMAYLDKDYLPFSSSIKVMLYLFARLMYKLVTRSA